MEADFRLSDRRQKGTIVKENPKTVLVKFDYKKNIAEAGAEALFKTFTAIIKRHRYKHNLKII